MTGLEVLLAVAGFTVTVLVVVGMVLITPRGQVDLHDEVRASQGSDLSRADMAFTSRSDHDDGRVSHPERRG